MHMRRRRNQVRAVILSVFCFVSCASIDTDDREDQALTWLASEAAKADASMSDVALFAIATGYQLISGSPMVLEVDGSSTVRAFTSMKQVVEQGTWTNEQYAVMGLLGTWTNRKYPDHLIVSELQNSSEAFGRAYAGSNELIKVLLRLNPGVTTFETLGKALPDEIKANIDHLELGDLVKRTDSIPLVILLIEYIRKLPADSVIARNWLHNVFYKVPDSWRNSERNFKFRDSPHDAYSDTCVALIILGGFYGSGPIHSRQAWLEKQASE